MNFTNPEDLRVFMKEKSKQAVALGKSLGEWVGAGAPMATQAEIISRRMICGKCDFWNAAGYKGTGACRKCTCAMAVKIRMETAACPLGKW